MKKIILTLIVLLQIHPVHAADKLNIVATLPIFGAIAKDIVGDKANVTTLARANQDPHFLDAKPAFVVALNKADVLIHGGLGLEAGWLPPIVTQSKNSKIQVGGNIDVSRGISLLEVGGNRLMGDVHPQGNPHIWLDPRNGKIIAVNIAKNLERLDPANAASYQQNLRDFITELNAKITQWQNQNSLRGKNLYAYHKSFSYLENWLSFKVTETLEPRPGIPPGAGRALELIEKAKAHQVAMILVEDFYPKKIPQLIADKTGIPLKVISTQDGNSYIGMLDKIMGQLK